MSTDISRKLSLFTPPAELLEYKGVKYLKVEQRGPTANGGSEITGIYNLYHVDSRPELGVLLPAGTWNSKLRERDASACPSYWGNRTVVRQFNKKSDFDRARGEEDDDSTSKTGVSKPTKPIALMSPEEFDQWLYDADEEAGQGMSDEQFESWLDGGDSKNENIDTTSKNTEAVASSSGETGYNAVAQIRARLESEGGNDDDESTERKEINEDTDDEPCYDFDPHCGHWGCDHCLRDGETPAWPRVETDDLEEDDDDPEWEQQWSVEHGKFRYFNTRTQETQWEKPDAPFSPEYGWDPYIAGEM